MIVHVRRSPRVLKNTMSTSLRVVHRNNSGRVPNPGEDESDWIGISKAPIPPIRFLSIPGFIGLLQCKGWATSTRRRLLFFGLRTKG